MTDVADYDQLSHGQLHDLCKQRGCHKEDTKAALRPQLAATDAANNKNSAGSSNDMDTPKSVSGKRTRTVGETMETGMAADGDSGKRSSSEALEIALAVDL